MVDNDNDDDDDDGGGGGGCAGCSKSVVQPDGSTTCYNLYFAGDTWLVANRQCASRGPSSRLATVSSAEQNDAITTLLQDNGLSESWLAASETEHTWQWLDGI